MKENTCAFFGHRTVSDNIEDTVFQTICNVIEHQNVTVFLVGGHGEFDAICASMVRKAKRTYPHIRLILVQPKMTNALNTHKESYAALYDDVVVPTESDAAYYKAAIRIRNQWIARHADIIISYLRRPNGGAFEAVKYAEKEGKYLIII